MSSIADPRLLPRRFGPGRNETTAKIAIGSIAGTFFANAR
jgi:hypothetical protein